MGKKSSGPKSVARTTAITPATPSTTTLSLFSPVVVEAKSSTYYAHLLRAPDSHTLRVYETSTGKCISRWASNSIHDSSAQNAHPDDEQELDQRVASLTWVTIPSSPSTTTTASTEAADSSSSKRGKKRRKSDSGVGSAAVNELDPAVAPRKPKLVLALGLENGQILLWSPTGSNASPTVLSHPSAAGSAVTALAAVDGLSDAGHLWAASADGTVRVWDLTAQQVVGKVSLCGGPVASQGKAWHSLAVRYSSPSPAVAAEGAVEDNKKRQVQLVLSHLTLHVYSLTINLGPSKKDKVRDLKAVEVGRCTGHTDVGFVHFTPSPSRNDEAMEDDTDVDAPHTIDFVSYSQSDRFVQLWTVKPRPADHSNSSSSSRPADGALVARLGLDSGCSAIALSSSLVAGIDSVGKVSIGSLPGADVTTSTVSPAKSSTSPKKAPIVAAIQVQSEIDGPSGEGAGVVQASPVFDGHDGYLLCRGGVKPVFEIVRLRDADGAWMSKIELAKAGSGLLANGDDEDLVVGGAAQPTRYSETASSAVRPAEALPQVGSDDEDALGAANAGELDVDMAEPTLAERLKALNVSKAEAAAAAALGSSSDEDDDDDVEGDSDDDDDVSEGDETTSGKRTSSRTTTAVPATTLTTTLIQALHSTDGPLLESCLTHSNPTLVRNTVQRLPSGTLVLTLLEQLVERLGTGKKGAQGNASVKRSRALIEWVRQTLIVHVGFLVTIPSLVTRLAALHASLSSRLALQPTLLALNGRLELVMAQIDMRQARNDAQRLQHQKKIAQRSGSNVASSSGELGGSGSRQGGKYVEGQSSSDEDDEDDDEDEDDDDVEDVDMKGVGDEGEDLEDDDSEDEGSIEDVAFGSQDDEEFDDDDGMGFDEDEDEDEEEDEEGEAGTRKRKVNGVGQAKGGIKMGVADLLNLEASEDDEEDDDDDEEEDDEDSDEEADASSDED